MENINGIKQREELTVSRKFDVRTMLAKCERHKMAQKQNRHLTPLRKTEHECAARGYFDLNCLSSVVCLLGNDFVVFRVLFTCFFVCLFYLFVLLFGRFKVNLKFNLVISVKTYHCRSFF